jgi:hypothetical protein
MRQKIPLPGLIVIIMDIPDTNRANVDKVLLDSDRWLFSFGASDVSDIH